MACTLVACASPAKEASVSVYIDPDWKAEDYKYRIGAGDELGVRFPVNPDLNAQVTVGPDGRAVFPLIRGLKVDGLTVEEVDAALAHAYGGVLRQPLVEAQIYNYAAGQVYVGGEVQQPGARPIRGQYTVTQAVMSAGGFNEQARMGKVVVLRRRPEDGHVLMRVVDVGRALKGGQDANFLLLPGDVVFVPRSQIAEVDRIVRQYVTNALPFTMNYQLNKNGVFNTIIPGSP
jgi:protein involved in polysaccharide export with SLBB domain